MKIFEMNQWFLKCQYVQLINILSWRRLMCATVYEIFLKDENMDSFVGDC